MLPRRQGHKGGQLLACTSQGLACSKALLHRQVRRSRRQGKWGRRAALCSPFPQEWCTYMHVHTHKKNLTLPCTTSPRPPAWGKGWVPTSWPASPNHRKTYEGLRLTWDSPWVLGPSPWQWAGVSSLVPQHSTLGPSSYDQDTVGGGAQTQKGAKQPGEQVGRGMFGFRPQGPELPRHGGVT